MLFKRQKFDWILVALLALGLFLYASYQPRFRLRPEMAADFIDEPLAQASQKPSPEVKIARAYWSCLVEDIQWKYGYGRTLPVDPPPRSIAIERPGLAPEDAAAPSVTAGPNASGISRPHGRKLTSGISIGRLTGF